MNTLGLSLVSLLLTFAAPSAREVATGTDLPRVALRKPTNHGGFWCYAFSPDGRSVAGGTGIASMSVDDDTQTFGGEVVLWDARSGKLTRTLGAHEQTPTWVEWKPDGKGVVSMSAEDGVVKVWRARGGKARGTFELESKPSSKCSPQLVDGGDVLVSVGTEVITTGGREHQIPGALTAYELPKGKVLWSMPDSDVIALDAAPDGESLVVLVQKKQRSERNGRPLVKIVARYVALLDAANGEERWRSNVKGGFLERVAIAPDGETIVAMGRKSLKRWSAADGTFLGGQDDLESTRSICTFAVDPEGASLLRVTSMNSQLELVRVETGEVLRSFDLGFSANLARLTFSNDLDRCVATVDFDPSVLDLEAWRAE